MISEREEDDELASKDSAERGHSYSLGGLRLVELAARSARTKTSCTEEFFRRERFTGGKRSR